jgi:hypothetical protein
MATLHNMKEVIVPTKKLGRKNVMRHQLNKWCNYMIRIRHTCTAPQREICALLEYYAACGGNSLPTVWDNLSVQSARVFLDFWTLEGETDNLTQNTGKELPFYAA